VSEQTHDADLARLADDGCPLADPAADPPHPPLPPKRRVKCLGIGPLHWFLTRQKNRRICPSCKEVLHSHKLRPSRIYTHPVAVAPNI
jgi:hypothetical protein